MPFLNRALHSAVVCLAGIVSSTLLFLAVPTGAADQNPPPPGPNSDPTYQALRNVTLGGEAVSVINFDLKRGAGTFHLRSGTVCFVNPVQGRVTGAVFVGDGNFVLDPPLEVERKSLNLLTKETEFSEKFEHLVLRFTDSTYDDIKKGGNPASGGCDAGLLKDSQNITRHKLKHNLEARILEEVLSPEPRALFVAFIHGKHYNDKEIYEIDPNWGSDQISFRTYDENKWGNWASFGVTEKQQKGAVGKPIRIDHQQLETTFEKNGNLSGKATTTFVARRNGLRVVPFNLFRPLRVQSVTADGQPLSFIQEDKNDDGNFAVILPKALAAGETYSITTVYGGKEAVSNEGGGNYFPLARENWYPNDSGSQFGEYTSYDMTFRIPKGMRMAATGVLVSENNEGGQNVTVWKSETPQTVAGFSFGKFKEEEVKLTKPEYFIQSFANQESPDWVRSLQHAVSDEDLSGGANRSHVGSEVALGTMSTTGLNKKALAEGELSVQLYTDYFGPSLFKHIQLTQQTACNFGQSWPELVWIPLCYYFDTTVRHQLGMDWGDRGYWKVVTPHEVAHQWWGHTVGFGSSRDQWMSEGFADMSASLYLSMIEKDQKKFITFWNDERELLLERDAQGFRAIDVGPVTMGYRANNSRTGFNVTRRLIYPKGAYILHMIRMMMRTNHAGDQPFKELMQDFVKTYSGKAATTEDFKAMVEKHMTREMDLENNHRLDWFFNEYVYGTQLPSYKMESSFDIGSDGDVVMNVKVSQSGVDDKFRMLVPIYLELAEGKTVFLGRAPLTGNTPFEQKIPLKGLKAKPRRAVINYYDDVLASPS
jgi:peptidase M1-like protein